MAIDVSVQYNGGLLPDMILLTQCFCHRGTRLKCHEEVLYYLQPMIPPIKGIDIFPLTEGCSEGLDASRFFLNSRTNWQCWFTSFILRKMLCPCNNIMCTLCYVHPVIKNSLCCIPLTCVFTVVPG